MPNNRNSCERRGLIPKMLTPAKRGCHRRKPPAVSALAYKNELTVQTGPVDFAARIGCTWSGQPDNPGCTIPLVSHNPDVAANKKCLPNGRASIR